MANRSLRILNIEDSERDHELLRRYITANGFDLTAARVDTAEAAERSLTEHEWDVIICDYAVPHFSAPEALKLVRRVAADIPFIIISGTVGEDEAVKALKAGADDYLMKDNLTRLIPAIEREMEDAVNRHARREAEESLKSSEAELRDLFGAMNDLILVLDGDGRHLKIAPSSAKDHFRPLLGKTLHETYDPETADLILTNIRMALDGNCTQRLDYRLKIDGDEVCYEASISPMSKDEVILIARDITERRKANEKVVDSERQLADAQKLARVGRWNRDLETDITLDITERKRSEEELMLSEERYRDLVENAHDIIYSHDLQGNYTSINQAGENITGYSREEALGMNLTEMVAPEFIETAREMMEAKLRGEESTAYELEILSKNGNRVSVEVNSKLIKHDGVVVGVQGIARDISSRKRLEEQLRQAQKLESVGRLAGGIAHDFNNMLTAINGYSDLTLRQLPADHRVRRNIEEIKKAGERSALLTNQLLAFSRRQMLHPEVVDLNDVISDTTAMLKRMIGEDIELVTELNPKVGNVSADKGQLSQIIMNLAVNARDAMPNGGKLTITTSNRFVDPEYARKFPGLLAGAYVKLVVSDTGTGIKDSDLQHIFEPFFTTKEVGKGTGLGLATVYGIIKQSGGSINVISSVGAGTTFEILLPRVAEEATGPPVVGVPAANLPIGPETVLLVEDEELVRSFLSQLLEACGYKVIATGDGASAVELCRELTEPIDLLITDVVMPQMSGRELAQKLTEYLPSLPVIFISGYTDDALVRESILDSGVNFIQKPFTLESISGRVREVLDEHKRNSR